MQLARRKFITIVTIISSDSWSITLGSQLKSRKCRLCYAKGSINKETPAEGCELCRSHSTKGVDLKLCIPRDQSIGGSRPFLCVIGPTNLCGTVIGHRSLDWMDFFLSIWYALDLPWNSRARDVNPAITHLQWLLLKHLSANYRYVNTQRQQKLSHPLRPSTIIQQSLWCRPSRSSKMWRGRYSSETNAVEEETLAQNDKNQ